MLRNFKKFLNLTLFTSNMSSLKVIRLLLLLLLLLYLTPDVHMVHSLKQVIYSYLKHIINY